MPGVYREKDCPHCGIRHRKRGIYCSQSCASTAKEPTQGMRDHMREVAIEYNKTPEAIAQKKLFNSGISIEDFAVDIPTIHDMPDGYEETGNW